MQGAGDWVFFLFLLLNSVGLLFGGLVLSFSVWFSVDRTSFLTQLLILPELEDIDYQTSGMTTFLDYTAYVLVLVGLLLLLHNLLGFTAAVMAACCTNNWRNGSKCLHTYSILAGGAVLAEVVVAVLVLEVYREEVVRGVREYMDVTLTQQYGQDATVSLHWDHIMDGLGCCGVSGYRDFPGGAPPSCCSSSPAGRCPSPGSDREGVSMYPTEQMKTGCLPLLLTITLPSIATALALLVLFQVVGMVLSWCLTCYVLEPKPTESWELEDRWGQSGVTWPGPSEEGGRQP